MVTKRKNKNEEPEKATKTPKAPAEKKQTGKEICEKTELGEIKIHENVIGDVVREAVQSMKGTVELEGSSLIESIAGLVGTRTQGAIGIDMKEDMLNIALKVNVLYGENVPAVSAKIQSTVKSEIKKTLGLDADRVDVFVQKLIRPEPEEAAGDLD